MNAKIQQAAQHTICLARHALPHPEPATVRVVATVATAVLAALTLVLSGCASSAGIAPHAKALEAQSVGVPAPAEATAAVVSDRWWTGFNDPALNSLVDRALADSPSLRLAQARADRASAAAAGARANEGPRVDGSVDVTRQKYSANSIFPPPLGGSYQNSGNVQLTGSWELDFFGRNRALLDSAIGNERAAQVDVQAARIFLSSAVVREYVQLARWMEQREIAERTLAQRTEVLGLIDQRVKAGLDTNVELRQGEGAVPELRAQLEAVNEQIALTRHALAALTAQPPQALDSLTPRLAGIQPIAMPEQIPADLLGQRADIEAARLRAQAASRTIDAAKAQFYPNVSLTAFVGLNSLALGKLFEASSSQYGFGPALSLPIFDSGRLRANLSGTTAEYDAAVESYNATLLSAVHDVADQISSVQSVARQLNEQAQSLQSAEQAYDLAVQRYRAGLGNYLTVLTAENTVLTQRRVDADLRTRTLDSQVLLAQSLGGGYTAGKNATVAAAQ